MNGSLYIGATGLKGLAEGMNVITNNLANANTVGYKQQSMLFSDLMYETQGGMGGWWGAQTGSYVALGQMGKGVQVDSVRTLFTPGGYEMGIDVTDISIGGKGFFEVTTVDGATRYTRAGNFRFDKEGFLCLPDASTLTGFAFAPDGTKGGAEPIKVDMWATSPAKATSQLTLALNLGLTAPQSSNATDPYFSMVTAWDETASPPLSTSNYGYTQTLRTYDANGAYQDLKIYFDLADGSAVGSSNKVMQYVVAPDIGGEMLMTGTLTFNSAGQLMDMSAFTSNGGDQNDLATWIPAALEKGSPQFSLGDQTMSLNLGITAPNGWVTAPASAADVGTDPTQLASMGTVPQRASNASTAYAGTSNQKSYIQDGYAQGSINGLDIQSDGSVIASFTNGQSQKIYEIPICRFTSEDGLRREGNNLFSMTPDAGAMEMGRAGTENYGALNAHTLEISNVDMAREMVNMIVTQRGFQSNSKVISTADTMLQRAIEMKR